MGIGKTGLERRVELLQQNQEYQQLLQMAYTTLVQGGNLADIADIILRPIAGDLTRLNAGKVVLHMFIIPKE
jgi:hypothetical protein